MLFENFKSCCDIKLETWAALWKDQDLELEFDI